MDADSVETLKARFPDTDFKVGDKVQFAKFEAPEKVAEPEM